MATPYIQDADQWVSFYLDMAEKKVLNTSHAYKCKGGGLLIPVEQRKMIYEEAPTPKQPKVKVELVSHLQQTLDQAKEELKEEKSEDPTASELAIKVPKKRNTLIRKRAFEVNTSPDQPTLYDQFSDRRKKPRTSH